MNLRTFLFAFAVCFTAVSVKSFADEQSAAPAPAQAAPVVTGNSEPTPVQGAVTEQKSAAQAPSDNRFIRKKSYEFDRSSQDKSNKESQKLEAKRMKAELKAAEKLAKEKKEAEKREAKRLKVEQDAARKLTRQKVDTKKGEARRSGPDQKKGAIIRPANQGASKIGRYLADAKEYYAIGELTKAEASIKKARNLDLNNNEAIIWNNKIVTLITRMADVKKDYSEQCYYKGDYFFKSGNILDALHLMGISLRLNPQSEKAKTLLNSINELNEKIISHMGKNDGRKLRNAISAFAREDYYKSVKIFRELQAYYPEATDFLASALTHEIDDDNKIRSMDYVNEAADNIRHERYNKAQENLYLALEMDRENINAMVLYEQVRPEADMFSMGATGTYHQTQTPAEFNIDQNQEQQIQNPVAR